MKSLQAATAAMLLMGMGAACAAGLQISQVIDRSPELMVFVATAGAAAPPAPSAPGSVTAAWGATTLKVKSFSPWDAAAGATVVVAMDVSGSMKSVDFRTIVSTVGEALSALPPASKAALMTIGSEVSTAVDFGPVAAVKDALATLTPNAPETALNEGLLSAQSLAARGVGGLPLRRFALLVTDGIDESKKAIGTREMMAGVATGEVPIFVVAVSRAAPTRQHLAALEPLASVARASGGDFVLTNLPRLAGELKALFAQALRADLLTLDCPPGVRDGEVHPLQVSITRNDITLSGVRELRLLAQLQPPAPPPSAGTGTQLEAKLSVPVTVKVSLEGLWRWLAALLALLVPAAAGGYVYRKQIKVYIVKYLGSEKKSDDGVIVKPDEASQAPPGPATMEITADITGVGRTQLKVGATDIVFGRSPSADVSTEKDGEASSKHAALYVDKGILMVRDLGSSNGTFLNGTRILRPEPVHDRDVVRIGRTDVRIYLGRL